MLGVVTGRRVTVRFTVALAMLASLVCTVRNFYSSFHIAYDDAWAIHNVVHNDDYSIRVTTSVQSGRRFVAMVANMMDDKRRLKRFKRKWKKAWPGLHAFRQLTFLNHNDLRGYGILAGFVQGMYRALDFANTGIQFDYLIIFEDDGLPFPNTTWPNQLNNDLDSRLDALEKENGDALFLGGHTVFSPHRAALREGTYKGNIAPTNFTYGAYAWVVRRRHLGGLYEHFESCLQNKLDKKQGTPDKANLEFFNSLVEKNVSTGAYISVPLLVDHGKGMSRTWKKKWKYTSFEGRNDWWNVGGVWRKKFEEIDSK